jgi:hypothetical protein
MNKSILFILLTIICGTVCSQDLEPKNWPNLKGYWKFQNAKDLTKATIGANLVLVGKHQMVSGPAYGDTAVRVPLGSYYKCKHNIAPNGGGDSVNQYTLMFDFKVKNFDKWHTFFQTDSTNANDGECFIRPSSGSNPGGIGTATTGYTTNPIKPNVWYRLMISVNLNNFYRYYINGTLVLEGDTQEVDDRFALLPQVLFFADNNNEDDTIDIASIAIFDTCLSTNEIAKIGSIEPCIANPPKIYLGNDTALCADGILNLDAGSNYINYQWSTGNKLPFEYINSNTLGIGKKQVWVKVTDRNGCTGADTIEIEYLPLPFIQLGNDTSVCEGQKLNLFAGSNKSHTYLWKLMPKGAVLSTSNVLTTDSTGKYTVLVKAITGCFNTDTISIIVHSQPAKPKINTIGNTSFCKGDSVKLEGPGSFSEYIWSNGSRGQHQYFYNSINLVLKVKDQFGCFSIESDTIRIKQFGLPAQPSIEVFGDLTFCDGDSIIFKVKTGYKQYNWQDGVGNATRVIKKPGIFNVKVIDSNSCLSPVSNSVQVSILNAPAKPVITILGKSVFCEGETALLSAPTGHSSYIWTDSIKTVKNTVSKSGNYSVKVKDLNNCFSPWSDAVSIIVKSLPTKPAVVMGNNDSLTCNTNASKFKWYRNSVLIQDTFKTLKPGFSGYYQVQTSLNDCWSRLSDSFYYKNLKINHLKISSNTLRIFPNPAQNEMWIYGECTDCSGALRLDIINVYGQLISSDQITEGTLKTGIPFNTLKYSPGNYFIKISQNEKIYTGMFQKR